VDSPDRLFCPEHLVSSRPPKDGKRENIDSFSSHSLPRRRIRGMELFAEGDLSAFYPEFPLDSFVALKSRSLAVLSSHPRGHGAVQEAKSLEQDLKAGNFRERRRILCGRYRLISAKGLRMPTDNRPKGDRARALSEGPSEPAEGPLSGRSDSDASDAGVGAVGSGERRSGWVRARLGIDGETDGGGRRILPGLTTRAPASRRRGRSGVFS